MMNRFCYDQIVGHLESLKLAVQELPYREAQAAIHAVSEIGSYVETIRELSKFADHLWNEADSQNFPSGWNPPHNPDVTYVDQWAARYELARRRLLANLEQSQLRLSPAADCTAAQSTT